MTAASPARGLLSGLQASPAIIAHGQGNTSTLAASAIAAGADYLEVDLWVHRGAFEARHERRFPHPLPVLFEKWYLKLAPSRPQDLLRLLEQADGRAGVFLDLKNSAPGISALIGAAVQARPDVRVAASSQRWATLRALARLHTSMALYYSIDVQAQLDLFLSVVERDERPSGVSCRHSLLTKRLVRDLVARGLEVVAWTVDDPDRAAELVAWGVTGITTNHVPAIAARFRR